MPRPIASLSVDLDDLWTTLRTRGDDHSDATFLPLVVPRILEVLADAGLEATVFVVGRDAAKAVHRDLFARLGESGHELGNHSFEHRPWLHLLEGREVEAEIVAAEDAIADATGHRPLGFRGPGFSVTDEVRRVLRERGYFYDASTWPTWVMPVARALYFRGMEFTAEQRRERDELGGSIAAAFASLSPHLAPGEGPALVEMPVTTLPLLRTPIHLSYVQALAAYSRPLALGYFRAALAACRFAGVEPSILLHPTDFVGREDRLPLDFFPGMNLAVDAKLDVVRRCLAAMTRSFEVLSVDGHARRAAARLGTPATARRGPAGDSSCGKADRRDPDGRSSSTEPCSARGGGPKETRP